MLLKSSIDQNLLSNLNLFKGAEKASKAKVDRAEFGEDAISPWRTLDWWNFRCYTMSARGNGTFFRNVVQVGRFNDHCVRGKEFGKIEIVIFSNY